MNIDLSNEELALLQQILGNHLPSLREEIYKTEKYEWRESLKHDEEVLKGLMARLDKAQAPTGT